MLKIIMIFRFDYWRGTCLCRKMSSSIMKIFVSAITFFKTSIQVIGVKSCKLGVIGVKMPLEPCQLIKEFMRGKIGRLVPHPFLFPF
jgi:hypothetical protein